jgi:Zn-dependent peptidase ImmA (M78 family)/transcriptional regulator with XRE-family HTH domain
VRPAASSASRFSITKAGLSKYERGGSVPKARMLRALAKTLGVSTDFFLEEPSTGMRWLAFRKALRLGKKQQERIKTLASVQVDAFLVLRHALEPTRRTRPIPITRVKSPEDAESAAQKLRDHWRLGDQPIESVTTAIEDGGGVVVESGDEDDFFDGLSGWANEETPVVVVSAAVSDDRRRFSLAHELGHLLMDVRNVDPKTEEQLAHRFAAAFLVTATTARRELGDRRRHLDFRELATLKLKHGLSMQAWILRAVDLDIIELAHAGTLFAEMSARGWRKSEPVEFEGRERPMRLRQLTVRALAEGVLSRTQAEKFYPDIQADLSGVAAQLLSSLDARRLMRMPRAERAALLTQAAALVETEYDDGGALSGLESLAEGDHSNVSISDD